MPRKRRVPGDAKIAVAYLRVSTDEQHLGPEAQKASIEAWAGREGVRVAAWHQDQGISGASELEDRPGLNAALDALREHKAGVLVVAKRDRLARDVGIAGLISRIVERYGATVRSADGKSDGQGPEDRLMQEMLDVFAGYERRIIAHRTKAALGAKRARGEAVGKPPFGFRVAPGGRLEPDEGEQATLAAIARLWRDDATERGIVAELEARGFRARTGKPLGQTQVHRILERFRREAPPIVDAAEEARRRALDVLGVPDGKRAAVDWSKLGVGKARLLGEELSLPDRRLLAEVLRVAVPDRYGELKEALRADEGTCGS